MFTSVDVDFRKVIPTSLIPDVPALPETYDLVITGAIGAGKSTLCEILRQLYPEFTCFPEYLSIGDAESKGFSSVFLKKKIADPKLTFTFQSFVLDAWHEQLIGTIGKRRLFERCVDDSVICFANIDNYNHNIRDEELVLLFNKMREINRQYQLPSYFDDDSKFVAITSGQLMTDLQQILEIISADVRDGVQKRIIGLRVNPEESLLRIQQRARDGESGYTQEQVKEYTNLYDNLFNLSSSGKFARYLDIGKLL